MDSRAGLALLRAQKHYHAAIGAFWRYVLVNLVGDSVEFLPNTRVERLPVSETLRVYESRVRLMQLLGACIVISF